MAVFDEMSLLMAVVLFVAGAAVIGLLGPWLTTLADRLADRTALGEAFMGAIFLGAVTSLPGITGSVTAALEDLPALSLSNAVGGIAAQTAFLVVADIFYRKANLEHAAASLQNMMQAALLIVLLLILLVAILAPPVTWLGVHPVTPLLLLIYATGMRMVHRTRASPMWRPRVTEQTREDEPDEPPTPGRANRTLWLKFAVSAAGLVAAGWLVTQAVAVIADKTAISESFAGAALLAVSTSLPELVTSVAAVRRGALTLAVGGIIGGNCFDTLFAAFADIAYPHASLYHAASPREPLLIAVTALMTATLLLGLLRRQKLGIAGIGFESMLILLIYFAALALIAVV